MSLPLEVTSLVRLGNRKLSHIGAGEAGQGKRDVAGGAGAVRSIDVPGHNAVAVEAVLSHRQPNLHPVSSSFGMT
jgi:hypothetical protein